MIGSWKILDRWEIFKNRFLCLRVDRCELPNGKIMPNYFVMEFSDWVHIVPVTKDKKLVMIEQYRHGAEGVYLEIPGGSTHPGANEDPLLAAKRELTEETGYTSNNWIYLGKHKPNPALQNNDMHTYLALDCEKTSEPDLDPFEDLQVKLMEISEVVNQAENGQLPHSLMLASLVLASSHLRTISMGKG